MPTYSFKPGPLPIKNAKEADAQVIGEALEEISNANGGRLKPHDVVEAATNRRHALHKFFEWNDARAAAEYRLDQARAMIGFIYVETATIEEPTHAYVSIRDGIGTAYRSAGEIVTNASLQRLVEARALADLEAWERRYFDLVAICDMVRAARQRLQDEIDRRRRGRDGEDEAPRPTV
jgi:hypothetical protein